MKVKYVVGFLFNEDGSQVALIRKNRPRWQAGKLNGIGGHIEADEFPAEAMTREFEEETGAAVADWEHFCLLEHEEWIVYFYKAYGELDKLQTTTDEAIRVVGVNELTELKVISNLRWLIPLALDKGPRVHVSHIITGE